MAKSLLLNVLVDVLGNYVEGLSKENLKVGVWSGTIELHNLKLRATALDDLNLPIKVERGSLKRLQVKIPWANLESKPVTVILDGIYLQAGPLDLHDLKPEDSQRMILSLKRKRIQEAEQRIMAMVRAEDIHAKAKKVTYIQQLTTKIIDNLEVVLTNVHIRYEDAVSIPRQIFSCGVTIESISLNTTDANWSPAFVSRGARLKETAIHKLGTMENFALYWNTSIDCTADLSPTQWEDRMRSLVYRSEEVAVPVPETMLHMLAPPSRYSMQVVHRETATETTPNLDVTLESTTLPFYLRDDQFQQLRTIGAHFADLDRRKLLITHRPPQRPTQDPRGWWHYAYSLITGRDSICQNKFVMATACLRARGEYTAYCRKKLVRQELLDFAADESAAYLEELEKIKAIEESLPLSALLAFCQVAASEAVLEVSRLRADTALMKSYLDSQAAPVKTSFWGYTKKEAGGGAGAGAGIATPKKSMFGSMFGSKSKTEKAADKAEKADKAKGAPKEDWSETGSVTSEDEADERLMDDISSMLEKYSQEASAAEDGSFTLQARLKTSMLLTVQTADEPIALLLMTLRSLVEMRHGNPRVVMEMDNFSLEDLISPSPIHRHIISAIQGQGRRNSGYVEGSSVERGRADEGVTIPPIDEESGDVPFALCFESDGKGALLRLKAMPLRIVLNEKCVNKLLQVVSSPTQTNLRLRSMQDFTAEIGLPSAMLTTVCMEVYAPTFIVPEEFDVDGGCLLLDTGKLRINGSLGPDGMSWDVLLLAVNVGMPLSMTESKSGGIEGTEGTETETAYLVQPFDVVLSARMSPLGKADIIVDVAVTPYIIAQLDAEKIVRLKIVLDAVLRSVAAPVPPPSSPRSPRSPSSTATTAVVSVLTPLLDARLTQSLTEGPDIHRSKILLSLAIPLAKVCLHIGPGHTAELSLSSIEIVVLKRALDMSIELDWSNIALTDSKRPIQYRSILWTEVPGEGAPSLRGAKVPKFSMLTMSSPQSPHFTGNQSEIRLVFQHLYAGIDDVSTLRYVPFMSHIIGHYNAYMAREHAPVPMQGGGARRSAPLARFAGSLVSFSMQSVSMTLLQDVGAVPGAAYEDAFKAELTELAVRMEASTEVQKEVHLRIRSFDIKDVRETSSAFVFNTLLQKNTLLLPSLATQSGDILTLTLKQEKILTLVEVLLQDVTSYVSVDIILSFVESILANAGAFSQVLAALNDDRLINELASLRPVQVAENKSLSLVLRVVNPRLLLLEDPTKATTKAIVSDCGIVFSLMKDTTCEGGLVEVRDSLHCALQDASVFVSSNLAENLIPHKIVSPTGLDVHMQRQSTNGIATSALLTVSSEDIRCRVSINDIVLTISILARAKLNKSKRAQGQGQEPQGRSNAQEQVPQSLTVLNLRLQLGAISVVLLNDIRNQNLPMLRCVLEGADFKADGARDLTGDGSWVMGADYYNALLARWEPILESWSPDLSFIRDTNGSEFTVSTAGAMQLNVTGTMCKCVFTSVALVSKLAEDAREREVTGSSRGRPPLLVRNELGIPIELRDSRTQQSLGVLGSEPFAVPAYEMEQVGSWKDRAQLPSFPDLFDLYLDARLPVLQAPLAATKPRSYQFHPHVRGKRNLQSEPIIEEVFENERYYPLRMFWGAPWTDVSDPPRWTDSRAVKGNSPQEVRLPEGWVWLDPAWRLDVGIVGVETDKEGWFCAANFASLSSLKAKRRVQDTLDVVRRRRWVRTRAPRKSPEGEVVKPIPVLWEVHVNGDESREVVISSGLSVHNACGADLEVEMLGAESKVMEETAEHMFAVDQDCTEYVPSAIASFDHVRIRRRVSGASHGWTERVCCRLKTDEISKVFTSLKRVSSGDASGAFTFYTVFVEQRGRQVMISVSPVVTLCNALPCMVCVTFANRDSGEVAVVEPGDVSGTSRVSVDKPLDLSLAIGSYSSLSAVKFSKLGKETVVWLKSAEAGAEELLCVTVKLATSELGVQQLSVYSVYLLVDQSDCAIVIKSDTSETPSPAGLISQSEFVDRKSYQNEGKFLRRSIVEQLAECPDIKPAWTAGLGGVTMFQAGGENRIALGVNCGGGWLDLSLDSLDANKSAVEVEDENSKRGYRLALSVAPLLGPLGVRVLRVAPCFMVVNYMDEGIDFLHPTMETWDPERIFAVPPKASRSWHRPAVYPGTAMRLRCESSAPSVGCVDINEIGTTLMVLPRKEAKPGLLIVAHVEVKFSDPADPSYITVVIWRSAATPAEGTGSLGDAVSMSSVGEGVVAVAGAGGAGSINTSIVGLSIRNDSQVPLLVTQDGVADLFKTKLPGTAKKFELQCDPGQWLPYGWTDCAAGSSLLITAGSSVLVVDTLVVNTLIPMGDLGVVVKTWGNGKVVHVIAPDKFSNHLVDTPNLDIDLRSKDLRLKLVFKTIGVSLMAERPLRKEFLSIYVENFEVVLHKLQQSAYENAMTNLEVSARDVHCDNYSETCVYPVLLTSINSDQRIRAEKRRRRDRGDMQDQDSDTTSDVNDEYKDFLQFSLASEVPRGQTAVVLKYVAFRMLELKLAVDSSSILLFLMDVQKDLEPSLYLLDEADKHAQRKYLAQFNASTLSAQLDSSVDVEGVFLKAQAHKFFFETLVIHPIKITATFAPTALPPTQQPPHHTSGLRLLQDVAVTMEDVQVRISSFIVRNAMESTASMRQRIVAKTVAELKSQVISLAGNFLGSLTFLGKPAGLYKNIGSGVQDFFYEPYLGSMESPSAFVLGLGKGTGSLISGVASGVLTSAATIVGTATGTVASVASGVAGLGGGDRYMRRREETQRAAKVAQGGVLGGLQAGGESMFSGVYSGVSGLVTKPYKEGKKAGALGFVKGIGLGLVGVATRPVLGITDGISNVAAGFTQQLQQSSGAPAVASHARPARALERADPQDGSNASLLLVPLNLWACEGQKYVLRKALERSYKDAFLASASLGFQAAPGRPPEAPCGVVLSERYLFLLNRQQHKVWEIPCPELSHILLGGDGRTVEFVEYSKDRLASPKRVLCASPEHSLRLYACLARFSHVMGNPGEVQAVAEVAKRLNLPAPGVGGGGMGSRSQSVDGVGGKMSSMGGGGSIGGDASPGSPGAGAGATYRFGSINSVEFPHISQSEEEVLAAAQARFKRISLEEGGGAGGRSAGTGGHSPTSASTDTYYRQLDEALWRLVSDWRNNHNALLNPSRCCACLVINNSPYFVQVREIELKSGLNYLVMGAGDGYDADSRSLSGGGGAAVFFAYGGAPSLTNLAHVKLSLFTSAFNAEQSTRKDRSSVTNHSGFHAGYLEKNQTDYWSKSVIVIKS